MLARTPRDLGLLIREQRRKLGLDQRELAARVGVSRQWIVEVEKGKPRAELGLVLRTLTTLGLAVDINTGELRTESKPDAPPRIDLDEVITRARGDKP